jgi:hypothetical protein
MIGPRAARFATVMALTVATAAGAHDGPPYPIASDRLVGAYRISVWTDPDTTDDGTPGGQFWVRLSRAGTDDAVPDATRTTVAISPLDRSGGRQTAAAAPVRGDETNQFAALVMDHEGRFAVHVTVDGPLGPASLEAEVDATYDLRPPPYMLLVYVAPFVLVGLLWGRLMLRRRQGPARGAR